MAPHPREEGVAEDIEAAIADLFEGRGTVVWLDDRIRPYRAYAVFRDRPPSPALYVELERDGDLLPVVVHNFADYGVAMRRWDLDPVDLVVLNELHELTHWAMTEGERRRWETRSRWTGTPDGHWLNPVLLDALEHLDGRQRRRRRRTSTLGRALRWLLGR